MNEHLHMFTHTQPHVGGQCTSGPHPQPCCMCLVSSSTPFSPSRCCCSAPSGCRKRHKGCLCCEPSASLTQVLSSNCQRDTWPDLSTCTDVDELRHCLDFFSFAFSAACVHLNKNKKNTKDFFLCPFLHWLSLFSETVVTQCLRSYWIGCNINYSLFCRLRGQSVTSLYKY